MINSKRRILEQYFTNTKRYKLSFFNSLYIYRTDLSQPDGTGGSYIPYF